MPRKFNTIKVSYWENAVEENLSPDEILIEFYLMTCRECGPTGIFKASPDSIAYYTGIDRGIGEGMLGGMTYTKIQAALQDLQKKDRLVIHPGGWVWIIGKWKHEHTRAGRILKMVDSELADCPKPLKQAFCDTYSYTVSNRVYNTPKPRVSYTTRMKGKGKGKEKEKEKKIKDMASKNDAQNININTDPVKPKRKYISIEDQNPKTPGGRLIKYWHVVYREVHDTGYSGDLMKMKGQVKTLLKKKSFQEIGNAMTYLLKQPVTQWVLHEFDHFIRKTNTYVLAAEEGGYEAKLKDG